MGTPIPAPGLHLAVSGVLLLTLAFLAAGGFIRGRETLRAIGRLDLGATLFLLLALAAHALLLKPLIPHSIWHELHGISTLLEFERSLAVDSWWSIHGPAFDAIMALAKGVTGGAFGLFTLNYLFSLLSAALLFLLLHLLSGSGVLALSGALLLLFLPAHLRISATESRFVLVETFSLLSLLLLAVYGRTRRPLDLAFSLAASLVVMHLRAELMVLVPAVGVLYWLFLRAELRPLPGAWLAARGWLSAAAVLAIPRAVQVLQQASPRVWDAPTAGRFLDLGVTGITPFFEPSFTPVLLPGLAAAGAVFLFRRHRGLFFAANLHWLILAFFYARHSVCVSHSIRFGTASLFLLAAEAAFGLHALVSLRPGRASRVAGWAVCCLLPLLPALRWDFLTRLYTQQQEFRFLRESADVLPEHSVVVYLSNEDDPDAVRFREHQRELLEHEALVQGKRTVLIGIRGFLELTDAVGTTDVFFYAGPDCYRPPARRGAGDAAPFIDPLCLRIREDFPLTAVRETSLSARSLRPDSISGDGRPMGLYRVAVPGRERPRARPKVPHDAGFWLGIAESARRLDALALHSQGRAREAALRALQRAAAAGPEPEQARRIARACQHWGDFDLGLKLLDGLAGKVQGDASFHADRGTLRALAGRKEAAVEDLQAALALEPGLLEAALTLGGIHTDSARTGEALSVYDAALRASRGPLSGERGRIRALIRAEGERLRVRRSEQAAR